MSREFAVIRSMVHDILVDPQTHVWSLQGLGMLRTYCGPGNRFRLHIWTHDARQQPDVSVVHDHPWDFHQWTLAGEITNIRYDIGGGNGRQFEYQTIQCGVGGGPVSKPAPIMLTPRPPEVYHVGDTYFQTADEIHETKYLDGSVSLIDRNFHEDTEHARIFWPAGTEWITAEPRPATADEVRLMVRKALERW